MLLVLAILVALAGLNLLDKGRYMPGAILIALAAAMFFADRWLAYFKEKGC